MDENINQTIAQPPEASLSKKKILEAAGLFLAAVVVGWIAYSFFSMKDYPNYRIDGVAPVTIYNHTGTNAYINNDLAASLLMVLRYYGEDFSENDLSILNSRFFDQLNVGALYPLDFVRQYAQELGYEAEWITLTDIESIQKYIHQNGQIPLIFEHQLVAGQTVLFTPAAVLIGVSEEDGLVTVHDYYWGYEKTLPFQDLNALRNPERRGRYLAIKPKPTAAILKSNTGTWTRTPSMDIAEPIINTLTLARVALASQKFEDALRYAESALTNPNFETHVPPYYKIVAYNIAGSMHMYDPNFDFSNKDIALVENLTSKSEALNKDLDKPFGDFWPGFVDMGNDVLGVLDSPYYMRGILHIAEGNYAEAVASFDQALAVWPYGRYTIVARNYALEKLGL